MLKELEVKENYLVRIKYEKPEGVVYKNIPAIKYPDFLDEYPRKALVWGLTVTEIKVVKKFSPINH